MKNAFTGGGGANHSFSTAYNHNENIFSLFSSNFFFALKKHYFCGVNRSESRQRRWTARHNLLFNAQKFKKMEANNVKFLSTSKIAAINAIAARININDWDDANVKLVFAEFQELRKEWEADERKEAAKVFFSNFDKLTVAKIKVVTRIKMDKTTKTSEKAKVIANVIFADVETQRKKVKGMLSNAVERKAQIYNLAYSKAFYLATFDTLTEEEFLSLYKGVATIKVEDVIGLLTAKLNAKK